MLEPTMLVQGDIGLVWAKYYIYEYNNSVIVVRMCSPS
jgi:hypothetical protein